jgi:putative transposase
MPSSPLPAVPRLPFPTGDHQLSGLAVPRFSLSLRDVEEPLAERGVAVTFETIDQWVRTFGPVFAQELRRRGRRPGDKLHLDEVTTPPIFIIAADAIASN